MKKIIVLLSLLSGALITKAQDTKPFTPTGDAKYYDFWVGDWHKILKDKKDTKVEFNVKKSIHPAAFYEEWDMQIDSVTRIKAVALRAWDKTNSKWAYTWVSDNGLYQVWDTQKVGNDWYIVKQFTINGDTFLSRQAWIPMADGKVKRVGERSHDNGITWQPRYIEYFERK